MRIILPLPNLVLETVFSTSIRSSAIASEKTWAGTSLASDRIHLPRLVSPMSEYRNLKIEFEEGTAIVILAKPERRNAMSFDLMKELETALLELADDHTPDLKLHALLNLQWRIGGVLGDQRDDSGKS